MADITPAAPDAQPPCPECGHLHTPEGCTGPPTPSDTWAGVAPRTCDCDAAEQSEAIREVFALGAAWALGDDDEAPVALKARAESAEAGNRGLIATCEAAGAKIQVLEAAIERTVEMLDGWAQDGPDDPAIHLLIQRAREALNGSRGGVGTGAGEGATGQDTGTAWVTRSADCPEAPAQAHLPAEVLCACGDPLGHAGHCGPCCGCGVASEHERMARIEHLRRCPICDMRFTREEPCDHEWLDRPESDTRECLICGTEVAG